MPLVAHSQLPSFERLRHQGQEVLPLRRALRQDIRELHIGLLNMMPDSALQATERQYMRLVGNCNQIAQFYVHPFTVEGLPRGPQAREYVSRYYETFENLSAVGLDALIVTGANVTNPALDLEPFWQPLATVIAWARQNVTSVLCSCLATHALVKQLYGVERRRMARKCWGVYSHKVRVPDHPLLRGVNTRFDVPHSRWNEITAEQLTAVGLKILVDSEVGIHMAASPDGLRMIYFQGHPEYDGNSLLKEYKRDLLLYIAGASEQPPPYPDNYFSAEAIAQIENYCEQVEAALQAGSAPPPFPERQLTLHIDNTWGDSAKALINNWLGLVYRSTNLNRGLPFMDGLDPNDPLGLIAA